MFERHLKNAAIISLVILVIRISLLHGAHKIDPYFIGLLTLSLFLLVYYIAFRNIKKIEGKLTIKMAIIYMVPILLITGLLYQIYYLFVNVFDITKIYVGLRQEFLFIIGSLIISMILALLMKLEKRYIVIVILLIFINLSFMIFSIMQTIEVRKQKELINLQEEQLERCKDFMDNYRMMRKLEKEKENEKGN